VRKRLGQPFKAVVAKNFLDLLAREGARFPGASWAHDFAERPQGWSWSSEGSTAEAER
jgi:hypothetical protein